jgi:hypothetical protein
MNQESNTLQVRAATPLLATLLGTFTEERISRVIDAAVRETCWQILQMVTGLYNAMFEPKDAGAKVAGEALQGLNINLGDLKELIGVGSTVLDYLEDREAKAAATRAATHKVELAQDRARQQVSGYAGIIRGELGSQSSLLDDFGIRKLGGRPGPRAKKEDKKAEKVTADTSKVEDTKPKS